MNTQNYSEHNSPYRIMLTLCMYLIISCSLSAQEFVCGMHDTQDNMHSINERSGNICVPGDAVPQVHNTPTIFIPTLNHEAIPIRINLFFLQRNDGTGNYQQNNEEHQYFLDLAIEHLNEIYANLEQDIDSPYCYVGSSFISNAKIRFEDHRYYIRDEYGWSADSLHYCPSNSWRLNYLDAQIRQCDTIPPGINVYFSEIADKFNLYESGAATDKFKGYGCSFPPDYENMYSSSRIEMLEYYSVYWCKVYLNHPNATESEHAAYLLEYSKWLSRALAHELGHSLDLPHPYQYTDHADPYKDCKNNIMNGSSKWKRNFLSPTQIEMTHYALMGSNLQNYVPENAYSGTKIVAENVSFPRMRYYHSLSIQAGVTMSCEAIMPKQATINVQNGGTLSIDGGNLHSITDSWNGIVVEDGGTLILSNTSITDYNIVVEDGGTLVIPNDIALSGEHFIRIRNGGCICVDEQATVTLTNPFSVIELFPYAWIGCNNITSAHCVEDKEDINISGSGKIVTYDMVNYIQNETISSNILVTGSSVLAGYNVTNQKPVGNVVVTSSGDLRIQATGDVTLTRDVEIQQGGSLTIQTNP